MYFFLVFLLFSCNVPLIMPNICVKWWTRCSIYQTFHILYRLKNPVLIGGAHVCKSVSMLSWAEQTQTWFVCYKSSIFKLYSLLSILTKECYSTLCFFFFNSFEIKTIILWDLSSSLKHSQRLYILVWFKELFLYLNTNKELYWTGILVDMHKIT